MSKSELPFDQAKLRPVLSYTVSCAGVPLKKVKLSSPIRRILAYHAPNLPLRHAQAIVELKNGAVAIISTLREISPSGVREVPSALERPSIDDLAEALTSGGYSTYFIDAHELLPRARVTLADDGK